MNNKFDKKYKQLLLEQRIISNVNLITQWNWGDFLNKAKSFIGLGPSQAQQAAKAAEEAAKQDPTGKIHQLSIKISDEELKQAEQIISKNPTLLQQYNAIEKIEDKKAFMLSLLQQAKADAKAKADSTFDVSKLDEKTKQLYDLSVNLKDPDWANAVWLKAVKQKKVICIGEGGKPIAVAKSKFQAKADRYLEKSKANMPTDEFDKESAEELIAKEENKDDLTKMLDIYVSAIGDEKKAKDDFAKYLTKGKVVVFKNGKNAPTTKEKFKADSAKYIALAQKYNPNAEGDLESAQIDPKDMEAYKNTLKKVLTAEPFNYAENKLDRILRKCEREKSMLVFKEKESGEDKKDKKDEKLITESWLSDIMEKIKQGIKAAAQKNNRINKYDIVEVDLKDFAANQDKYINAAEDFENDLKAKADAKAKGEADAKAKEQKFAQFKTESKKLFDDLPSLELAKAADGSGDNELKPPRGMILKSVTKKDLATWDRNEELDNNADIQAFRNFLNAGMNPDDPGHPRSLQQILQETLNSGNTNKVNWSKMGNCRALYEQWIARARQLADKYKQF